MDGKIRIGLCALLAALPLAMIGCRSPYYADRGAIVGGLAGAGLGAAIGENNDNPLLGAAIGAVGGTIAGSAIGSGIDADIAQERAAVQAQIGRQLSAQVTIPDVVAMAQAGVSEDVMIRQIEASGVGVEMTTSDVIALHQQGVPTRVIEAMQRVRSSGPRGRVAYVPEPGPRPVIVERHYVRPAYYGPPPVYHHFHGHPHRRPSCRPAPGVSWGITVH